MTDLNAHRCVWCGDFLAEGDRIACLAHRALIDKQVMPWDTNRPARPGAARAGEEGASDEAQRA